MFILPLSKPGGYVTLLTQMQLPFALVTPLEEYKRCAGPGGARGPVPPCLASVTGRPKEGRCSCWQLAAPCSPAGAPPPPGHMPRHSQAAACAPAALRRHGSAAPACMTITHYAELLDSKRLVLTRGDIVDEKLLSAQEVSGAGWAGPGGEGVGCAGCRACQGWVQRGWLAAGATTWLDAPRPPAPAQPQARTVLELLRAFYCSQDYTAVQDFNHNPGAFDFGALLKQCGVVADAARSSAPEQ